MISTVTRLARLTRACAVVAICTLASASPGAAQHLKDALAQAYQTNPSMLSERARLRATDENVAQALSGWRPQVSIAFAGGARRLQSDSVSGGREFTSVSNDLISQGQVQLRQPIYTGGTVRANVARSKNQVQAERARLFSTEEQVLLAAAQAYFDVLQARAVLRLRTENERVLATQLEATRDQFNVGEVTRTDVSQAQAALAGAIADRIQAEGDLNSALATYIRQVGSPAGDLVSPELPFDLLPTTVAEVQTLAATSNPDVIAAQFDENATRNLIDSLAGQLLPQVELVASYSGNRPTTSFAGGSGDLTTSQIQLQVTMPLYEGGQIFSQVRQAKQQSAQFRSQIDVTRRQAIETAVAAFNNLAAARARVQSLQTQIQANSIALEGVRQEQQVGSRTILDVLDAEQTLLNSQVARVQSERNGLVAAYQLLSAVGRLSAKSLELPVQTYDYEAYFNLVHDKWYGPGTPEPVR